MNSKPVIVGIDGSPDSVRALQWAAEYARRYEAPLQGLITWQFPAYAYPVVAGEDEYAALEEESRKLLGETVRTALGDNADVVQQVAFGHPAATLVAVSEDAQLLVLGTRGLGAFRGMLLGSVSQHCVMHSVCPVVVVPEEDVEKR